MRSVVEVFFPWIFFFAPIAFEKKKIWNVSRGALDLCNVTFENTQCLSNVENNFNSEVNSRHFHTLSIICCIDTSIWCKREPRSTSYVFPASSPWMPFLSDQNRNCVGARGTTIYYLWLCVFCMHRLVMYASQLLAPAHYVASHISQWQSPPQPAHLHLSIHHTAYTQNV